MLKERVKLFLEEYNLLTNNNNIIVAFSGGYDSMCLLDIMQELKNEHNFNLIAVHLNHNWRGEESDKEEEICREFCKNIQFYSEKLEEGLPHTETYARDARYNFFERCANKFNSKIVLTAHNANDNAETVYYRLQKGTGITGLEGIQEKRDIFYRPLLNTYRHEIEDYCRTHNLKPNFDSSNNNNKYRRNEIRNKIFPKLKEVIPNIEECLNNLSKSAKEANKIINDNIKNLEEYSTEKFTKLPDYYQNAIVHKFFREYNLDYDKKTITQIVDFINSNSNVKSGKKRSLTTDKWLFLNDKKIEIIKTTKCNNEELVINKIGEYRFGQHIFEIKECNKIPNKYPNDNYMTAYVELKDINLVIRNRKNGDKIQPLGVNGTQKIKKYFNERKIPNHEKDNITLLCDKDEVLWVAGYGISEKIRVKTSPTHIIKLRSLENDKN